MIKRNYKKFFKYLGLTFAVILILIFLINLFLPDRGFSDKENRVLASRPAVDLAQMASGRQEKKIETWVNDQFLFRDAWITLKAGVDRLLGKVENNGVWLCRDNYLMEDFTAPSQQRLSDTISAIESFAERHSDLSQRMLLVPNAVNILSRKLPKGAQAADQNEYMDSVKSNIREYGISFIDLREALKSHRDETIYYHTDHHWTTLGAYYAYREYAENIDLDTSILSYDQLLVSDSFQGTLSAKSGFRSGVKEDMYVFLPKNDTAPDYVVTYVDDRQKSASYYATEKLETRDKYAMFFNGNHAQVRINTPDAEERTLLIFKDSYANCFVPFLAPHYRTIIMIDPRYYYGNIDELIAAENVQEILYLYNANTFFTDTSLELTLKSGDTSPDGEEQTEETDLSAPDITPAPADQAGTGEGTAAGTETTPAGDGSENVQGETGQADGSSSTVSGGTEDASGGEGSADTYDESYDDSGYSDYDSSYDESYDDGSYDDGSYDYDYDYDSGYDDGSYYDESYDYDAGY